MEVGDKVRLLSDKEEGVITNFLSNAQVEVEISDGFRIPVLRSEIVVIQEEEAQYFGKGKISLPPPSTSASRPRAAQAQKINLEQGVFLAFVHFNDQILDVYLLNCTDFEVLFAISEQTQSIQKGIAAHKIGKQKMQKIHRCDLTHFENWKPLITQLIFFKQDQMTFQPPVVRTLGFKKTTFFKSKKQAPLIFKDAYLFRIDESDKARQQAAPILPPIDSQKIREQMLEGEPKKTMPYKVNKPKAELDLHIEALVEKPEEMNPADILQYQLQRFEQNLENAIAAAMDKITFIHGVGNGKLRMEIHRILSKHPQVRFYEDAQKNRFGYGATVAYLK
ncbi:MAG: Smr/MutS family protein [Bernardetiaceae bacterium]|nr:Smr/MutS family protein [Bernardetiaceae bacterium]